MGIFRNVSGIFIILYIPGVFKTMVYLEPWQIQNLGHIQNSVKHLRWSVLWKYLKALIIFAISAFHVFYYMKSIS